MRGLLPISFLFCVFCSNVFADACTPGQYSVNGICWACADGTYSNSYGATECTPCEEGFKNTYVNQSTGAGATSKYECYKILDGASGSNHGPRCIDADGREVGANGDTRECREYYRDDSGFSDTYQGYIGTQDRHWVVCSGPNGEFTNRWGHRANDSVLGWVFGVYNLADCNPHCSELLIGRVLSEVPDLGQYEIQIEPSPNLEGFHMEDGQCYQNTLPCTSFKNEVRISSSTTETLNGCVSPDENVSHLNWEWNSQSEKYSWKLPDNDNATCSCKIENLSENDWYADLTFGSSQNLSVLYGGRLSEFCEISSITFTGGDIVQTDTDALLTVDSTRVMYGDDSHYVPRLTNTSWECSGCPAGKVGFLNYNIGSDYVNVPYCAKAVKGCYSDGCKNPDVVPDDNREDCMNPYDPGEGYRYPEKQVLRNMLCNKYDDDVLCITSWDSSTGKTSGPSCSYYYLDEPYGYRLRNGSWKLGGEPFNAIHTLYGDAYKKLQRFYHSCYAGQTTEHIASSSITDCKYDDGTLFFDAYGTFKIRDIDSWTWWYQTGFNNSAGVDVSSSNTQQSQQID